MGQRTDRQTDVHPLYHITTDFFGLIKREKLVFSKLKDLFQRKSKLDKYIIKTYIVQQLNRHVKK